MKRLLIALIVLTGSALAQPANPGIVLVGSAPSGSCSVNLPDEQVVTLGTLYSCQSGTWTQITGGGGGSGITALTQDVTASGTGSVAATVVGINDTLLSGLASGLLYNTTSTGVPSIATSSQILTACSGCAPLASPTFTGVPAAPTASVGTKTTQVATTAFVQANGPTATGTGIGFWSPCCGSESPQIAVINAAMSPSATTAYCHLMTLPYSRTVTHAFFWVGTGQSLSTGDVGIYSADGTSLLASLGGVATTTSNAVAGTTITQTSVTLVGGTSYWVCQTNSNTTVTINTKTAVTAIQTLENEGTNYNATFTTSVSGGVLPSSMGSLTPVTTYNIGYVWFY